MHIRLAILVLLLSAASLVVATPLVEPAPCDEKNSSCSGAEHQSGTSDADNSGQLTSNVEAKGIFELLSDGLVPTDPTKLLDKRTAAMLNVASYPLGREQNLLGDYRTKNYLLNTSDDDSYGSSLSGRDLGDPARNSSRWRTWAAPENNRNQDRYIGSKDQSKAKNVAVDPTSWMSKSASTVEYAAVLLLGLLFWGWIRQSRGV